METNNMIKRDIVERELHPVSGMAMMVISGDSRSTVVPCISGMHVRS